MRQSPTFLFVHIRRKNGVYNGRLEGGFPSLDVRRIIASSVPFLERANHVSLPSGDKLALPQDCKIWFGNDLASKIEHWFDRGVRVPQELVGWDQLVMDGADFAKV
jgi:hypothetical protein